MKENILGIHVNTEGYAELLPRIFSYIENKEKAMIVAINPEKVMKASQDQELHNLLNRAEFQIPDGVGILIASKLQKGKIKQRVTGIDLMLKICEEAAAQKKSIFLYGAKPGVAQESKEELEKRYPNINISGIIDGYEKDQILIHQTINSAQPDILFVAMGSPRQEKWIEANRNDLYPSVYQGVGGSFDVLAGNIERAPEAFQKAGLEWFYRLLKEPSRIKRQIELPKFLWKILKK
ncbi:WecB/TagA/CpsF family glycosyltransferase [Paenisporosarcina quisquiliarum]|uniref:WecB/TagA/CpsF family glycosyltransferase n=1 Tax=Paenisporosarcina quisquiliarum TaxID=365346 RepID=UPI003735B7D9